MKYKTNYDIIGDIHGHADKLRELLDKLGYREQDGAFRHCEGRQVIFLGDFIDRGPDIRDVLRVVRAMHMAGSALAVPGNHEYNALAHATLDASGKPLRKCDSGHAVTLAQFKDHMDEWRSQLEWFRALPLWLELPGLRAVHAAWCPRNAEALRGRAMDDAFIRAASDRHSAEGKGVDALLKGIEVPLPDGCFFHDRLGVQRNQIRVKWWLDARAVTYREIAFQPEASPGDFPDTPLPADTLAQPGYAPHERPVFNGHYWLRGEPSLATHNVAILDYSVAGGGALTAYRWDGEQQLDAGKFVQVNAEKIR